MYSGIDQRRRKGKEKGETAADAKDREKDSTLPFPQRATRQAQARQQKKCDLRSACFIKEESTDQVRSCLFARLSRRWPIVESQTKSDEVEDSNMIARKVTQEKTLCRFSTWRTFMRRETLSAARQLDPKRQHNGQAQDMRVAYFQHAHPWRDVVQKRVWHDSNPHSPVLKNCEDRLTRVSRRLGTTHMRGRSAQELHKKGKGLAQTCRNTKILKGSLRSKQQTHPSPNRSSSRRIGCVVSTVVFACAGKENQTKDPKATG